MTQIKSGDWFIEIFCLFVVEILYMIYNSERVKRYEEAINQSTDNPFFSKKTGVYLAIIEIVIICMAVLSTIYFSDRAEYMLSEHGIKVTNIISRDLLHLQIQFLTAMLALNFILIILLLFVYQYMAYREYKGEMDYLTGIMGRRLFLSYCNAIQSENHRNSDNEGWFLFLDVDWFKKINDSLGHSVGDSTLREVAQILQTTFGEYGAVGRVGGDEFATIIDQKMSRKELEKKLDDFLCAISKILPEIKVSCSIGAYHFTYPQEVKYLLKETDEVLYQAKATGKACYVIRE